MVLLAATAPPLAIEVSASSVEVDQGATIEARVRAVLDRPLRPDPFVEVELHGRTTRG